MPDIPIASPFAYVTGAIENFGNPYKVVNSPMSFEILDSIQMQLMAAKVGATPVAQPIIPDRFYGIGHNPWDRDP